MNARTVKAVLQPASKRSGYVQSEGVLVLPLTILALLLVLPAPAAAHRLDEYLQATRISVYLDRVSLEIDLTAGVAVAPTVFALIDADHDGQVSAVESEAYAQLVLSSVVLEVDNQLLPITLVRSQFPQFRDMSMGVGTILLEATAKAPAAVAGRHQLFYLNTHRPDMSAYLVNALVPADTRIRISDQRRDMRQRELRLDYSVIPDAFVLWAPSWRFIAGLGLLSLLALAASLFQPTKSSPQRR